jgi:hypothetical protein
MLFTKTTRCLTYITLFFCLSSHTTTTCLTKKKTFLGVLTAITAYYAIKTAYQLYTYYHYPEKTFFKSCSSTYKEISQDAHTCLDTYYPIYQLSDLDLKEIIYTSDKELYPFLRYQEAIAQELRKFKAYSACVQKELRIIHAIKITTVYPQELDALEAQGKIIEKQILFINTLLTILNQRILLFTEYQEDCTHLMH